MKNDTPKLHADYAVYVTSGSHGNDYIDDLSSGILRCVAWKGFTNVSEVLLPSPSG
jgi:hypothetical protein